MSRQFRVAALLCAAFIAMLQGETAEAGGMPRPDLPDAQTLIQACWNKSQATRASPDWARQAVGFDETANCLEVEIMTLLDSLAFGDFHLSRPNTKAELSKLRFAVRRIYRMIELEDGSCGNACRRAPNDRYKAKYIDILEEIVRSQIWTAAYHTDQLDSIGPGSQPFVNAWIDPSIAQPGIPDPKVIVNDCWTISEKERSGNNSQIREGHLKTVLCLEEKIVDLYQTLFQEGAAITEKQLRSDLESIRFALGRIYWLIFNESDFCGHGCGTIWFSAHLPPISAEFTTIINDMIGQSLEKRMQTQNR